MSLTKCTECNILPTHHKCTVCKITLICPECCDKRGISDLNKITYKACQIREASIALAELSKSVTLTVNSQTNNNITGISEANDSLSITITEQNNIIQQILPIETIAPLNQIDLYTQSQDLSSLESVVAIQLININTNGQAFAYSSTGLALSSTQPP